MIVSRRVRSVLAWLVILFVWTAVPALAEDDEDADAAHDEGPRAVERLNGWVAGRYVFESREVVGSPANSGNSFWSVIGNVTAPLPGLDPFGARVSLSGGQDAFRFGGSGLFDQDISLVGADFQLFWRDPEIGTVAIGYQIFNQDTTFGNMPGTPAVEQNIQAFTLSGAAYLGDFDVSALFGVAPRTAPVISGLNYFTETGARSKQILLDVGPGYYVQDWLALRASLVWQRRAEPFLDVSLNETGETIWNSYEGRFAVDLQLPTTGRGPLIVSLFGGVGGNQIEYPNGLETAPLGWNVGAAVFLVYPRPESLKQWQREYR